MNTPVLLNISMLEGERYASKIFGADVSQSRPRRAASSFHSSEYPLPSKCIAFDSRSISFYLGKESVVETFAGGDACVDFCLEVHQLLGYGGIECNHGRGTVGR